MPTPSAERGFVRFANWALLAVVGLTLGMALMAKGFAPGSAQALWLYGYMLIYAAGGCAANTWVLGERSRGADWAYFAGQLLLYGVMVRLDLPQEAIWLLMMPVVSQAAMVLPTPGIAAVAAGYLLLHCGLPPFPRWRWDDRVRVGLSLSSAFLLIIGMTKVAEGARRARARAEMLAAALAKANTQLQGAAAQAAELAAANERNRIARDIHDGLGHYLTGITVQLQTVRKLLPAQPERAADVAAEAETQSRRALEDVRSSVGALRGVRSAPALADAIAGVVQESGLPARFRVAGRVRTPPEAAQQALFRAAQEGLTNVRKHAGAARAEVLLDFRDAGRICVEVTDDGAGAPGAVSGGFGLAGLQERVTAVGGSVHAGKCAGGGFSLRVEVPA